jgi:putative membrane protein
MKLANSFTTLKILTLAAAMSTTALVDAQERTRTPTDATGAATIESTRAVREADGNADKAQANANKTAGATAAKAMQTDGQILQVVRTLNNAEIDQAKHVMDESENPEVKVFAQAIINDHDASNDQINDLLDGALDLDDSPLNETLQEQTEDTKDMLAKLEGAQLDCQYLQKQIAQHQVALDTIKNDLTPDAQSAEVKQFLTASAPKLESHLQEAQEAVRGLDGCSSRAVSSN